MATNYGSIHRRARKPRCIPLIDHSDQVNGEPIHPDDMARNMEARLLELSKQNRAPSVAKAAAAELLERAKPKKSPQEPEMTVAEASRLVDIYDRIFTPLSGCPNCGHSSTQ